MTRCKLMENVYLTHIPSEKFKTSVFCAQMAVPLRRETAGHNTLLLNVLNRGTVRCPDMAALNRELDMLYGARLSPTVRKLGENQLLGFSASCIDDRFLPAGERVLEPLLELLGDMLLRPALRNNVLCPEYVESERANLADFIRSEINDKYVYASRRLLEEMCGGEPYSVRKLGEADEVEAITPQALTDYYHTLLPQARLELFFCGSAPQERAAEGFRRALAGLPRQGQLAPAVTSRRPAPAQYRVVEEAMDVAQGKLCMGFRTDSGDFPASLLMNAMFGGVTSSKLFVNVREKLSLCYYADSAYHRAKGLITVSAGIEFAHYQRAVDEIFAQLAALKAGDWEEWEIEGARNSLLNGYRQIEDSPGAMESFVIEQAVNGGDETIPGLMEDLRAVTAERVMAAAAAVRPDTIYFLRGKEAQG